MEVKLTKENSLLFESSLMISENNVYSDRNENCLAIFNVSKLNELDLQVESEFHCFDGELYFNPLFVVRPNSHTTFTVEPNIKISLQLSNN